MMEHFELALQSGRLVPEFENRVVLNQLKRVTSLRHPQPGPESGILPDDAESGQPKLMRLCSDSFPDLQGDQLRTLSEVCSVAHRSAEFFLSVATNQWVRTVIKSEKSLVELFRPEMTDYRKLITIHSNVLPCDTVWEKLRAVRNAAAPGKTHFPCSIIEEAWREEKGLIPKLQEYWNRREECEIKGSEGRSMITATKLLWDVREGDYETLKKGKFAAKDGCPISQVKWRGGMFIKKTRSAGYTDKEWRDMELDVMEKFSDHPHIIYGFGVSSDDDTSSVSSSDNATTSSAEVLRTPPHLFMECMETDLEALITDTVRHVPEKPPFLHEESVDILLQVAEAVAHLHENVVHCDIKSANIFISKFVMSETVKQYVVKVGDFGSAKKVNGHDDGSGFSPGDGTGNYIAPEVLRWRKDRTVTFPEPHKLDVYSFGIVAFEILTGEKAEELYKGKSSGEVYEGVIRGDLRPDLKECCRKHKSSPTDAKLIALVETCWLSEPSARPSFPDLCQKLKQLKQLNNRLPIQRKKGRSLRFSCFSCGNVR